MTDGGGGSLSIPENRRERNPLITEEGYRLLKHLLEHPDAPRWNFTVGDRLRAEDLAEVEAYRKLVFAPREPAGATPPPDLLAWIMSLREETRLFREHLPEGLDLVRDWESIPTMERDDLALRPESLVPLEADLERLIVYTTSGTTGHSLVVPHHPRANAQSLPLIEYALARYGVRPAFGPGRTAVVNVCAQAKTVAFASVLAAWGQAGIAKVNLHRDDWRDREQARRFFADLAPLLVSGDPTSLAEMLRWGIDCRPAAILSTALALPPALKAELERRFRCPVVDCYASTEVGGIAYACPEGEGFHVLPPDLFAEIVDADGRPVKEGERGEIAVTGGRNPYLPLLRYRTGDRAAMNRAACPCGDPAPRLVEMEGREEVPFRAADGSPVNAVDVSRVLRRFVYVQHEFVQRADGSCEIALRPAPGCDLNTEKIGGVLKDLFGEETSVRVREDPRLGEASGGKVVAYRSELTVE